MTAQPSQIWRMRAPSPNISQPIRSASRISTCLTASTYELTVIV